MDGFGKVLPSKGGCKMTKKVSLGVLVLLVAGILYFGFFWQSTDQIGENVRESMQQKFDTDANFKEFGLGVEKVTVIKDQGNHYQGIAKVVMDGEPHDVLVDITSDNSRLIWQIKSGEMMFVARKAIEKLQNQ